MPRRTLPLSEVYRLLEPGPVVLLTTARNGKANVMTMSWHTMIDFEPPIVGCVVSNRNLTFNILKATKECVINTGRQGCGMWEYVSPSVLNLSISPTAAASKVNAPLINECYANLECRIVDARMAPKYNFFILEVIKAWIDPERKQPRTIHHLGRGVFMVAGKTIKLSSKMK